MSTILSGLSTYWNERSDRERIMIGVMALLVIVLGGQLLVARPLMNFHDRARDDYAAAMRLYSTIETDAARYRQLAAATPAQTEDGQSLRSIVGSLALVHDIPLARLVPSEDGALTINIERAEIRAVMRWLVDLEERYGIQVMSTTFDREDDVFARVNLVLRQRS